jgi:hypothetical protein
LIADSKAQPRLSRFLFLFFVLSLPFINPIVHGDGVGYYAYARAPLIQHNLHFEEDWRHANLNFSQSRTSPDGQLLPEEYTETGYVNNLFTIGPAILWMPFLLLAHIVVLFIRLFGAHTLANGFSFPYILAMAMGTAVYGFLGLLLSFSLARKYENMLMSGLHSWARWVCGLAARFRFTCISTQPGPMRIPLLLWRFSFGIGTKRVRGGPQNSGYYWGFLRD